MADRNDLLALDDDDLLQQCEQTTFRATGPGGQHRNTTESAVRLQLTGTDIAVTAVDSRSQHKNRQSALTKLRLEVALQLRREPVGPWEGPWKIGRRDQRYPAFVATVLDALHAHEYAVGEGARALGTTTGRLIRLLARDPILWAHVNQQRQARGLHALRQS